MSKGKCVGLLGAVILLGAVVIGCGSDSSDGETGTLNLSITDAPVDGAAAVWVTFTGVHLQSVDGSGDQGPYAIPTDRQLINLMEYTGTDSAALITDMEVSAGTYKLRLDADLSFAEDTQSSWIAFDDSSDRCETLPEGAVWSDDRETCRYPLTIPSGDRSGFKPKGEIRIAAGGTSSFTAEFDLRKNIVDPSNPNDIVFKLKPTGLRLVDNSAVGSIAGDVTLVGECVPERARVYLYDLTDFAGVFGADDMHDGNGWFLTSALVRTITVEGAVSYAYRIGFVPAGTDYALALTCDDMDDPEVDEVDFPFEVQVTQISVVANQETTQDL
ncbi:MAG: DUF4382 domain-containing protein [Deferrisomatales bacterium]|nr:DUF4382 domain-containing protein [Deferrisomatales bacterium]